MNRPILTLLGATAFAVSALLLTQTPVAAGEPFPYPFRGSNAFGTGVYAPSYYGYNLDEMSAGYYGGSRYREYYSYGRGPGIFANYPGPLVGHGPPPDYRGPRPGTIYYESGPVMTQPLVPQPVVAQPALPPIMQGATVAQIVMEVPADAEVWIEGLPTKQAGTTRWYVSPPLDRGRLYEYRIRARWKENGALVEQNQQISVHAGDNATVSFPTGGKREAVSIPKPFPLEEGPALGNGR
jgi:uncharacterized protein (TIGR03000 family)